MNNENMNFNKSELIKKLEILRELEMKKPVNEIDTDFIDEIVLFGLELKGLKTTLTPEEVEEKVRKIPFVDTASLNTTQSVKSRATKVKSRKILLIAAIISILVAILAVSSIAFEWNIFDELRNRFGYVAELPVDKEINVNGITVCMHGENVTYNSMEDLLKKESFTFLYPTKLPDSLSLTEISVYEEEGKENIDFVYSDSSFTYSVILNKKITDEIKSVATEILKINDIECYVIEMSDIGVVQIHFEYNKSLYEISYNNKQDLIDVIENLRSYNEN
ncbi:MAG: hypothetical protein IKC01_05190 [Clostridia bacterium]|nr:hypothetical protein [Clostridia bacterium]